MKINRDVSNLKTVLCYVRSNDKANSIQTFDSIEIGYPSLNSVIAVLEIWIKHNQILKHFIIQLHSKKKILRDFFENSQAFTMPKYAHSKVRKKIFF